MSAPRVALLALAAAGCLADAGAFHCAGDQACDTGHCIAGACAAVDVGCPSGFRWDDSAGGLAGECAILPDLLIADQAVDPNCGNGVIDPGEKCDPGKGSPEPCPTAADCDDGEPCTDDFIANGGCQALCAHNYLKDGTACPLPDGGTPGVCEKHACCTGCWDGTTCASGTAGAVCGTGGKTCTDCITQGTVDGGVRECTVSSCQMDGTCAHAAVTDGTPCSMGAGECHGFVCCTGCVDGNGACAAGDQPGACGSGGLPCKDCGVNACAMHRCQGCAQQCLNRNCGADGCGGSCGTCPNNKICDGTGKCVCVGKSEADDVVCADGIDNDCNNMTDCADAGCAGMRCSNQGGRFCVAGSCKAACRIGGAVYVQGTPNPMNPCQVCDPNASDGDWTPRDGVACQGGTCRAGACCTGCWDGAQCRIPSVSFCGAAGADCVDCNDNNACHTPSCIGGACKIASKADGTPCGPSLCVNDMSCNCQGLFSNGNCTAVGTCQGGSCDETKLVPVTCCIKLEKCVAGNNGPYCTL